LKILQTCFSESWGGLELQALEITHQLHSRGHTVWLGCCGGSRLSKEAIAANLKTLPLDVRGYLHPRIAWSLSRFLRQQNIDVIHCQLSKDIATVVPAMLLSRKDIPIILSKRVGSYLSKKDMFHRLTYKHVTQVLAISEVIRRNVIQTTPMPPDRVLTLHDAVDTDLFSLSRVDRTRTRAEFGLSENTIVIGFVGRFSPGKGHEELLRAAATLRTKYPHVHFLIVGEASHGEEDYERGIRDMAHALNLESTVTFAGFRRDIPQLMAAFDIFAFPSHAESFGVVLIEAMAMERPVVSTNCDGVVDIVVDGETGLHVHPRHAEELANALENLIRDPAQRRKFGKAGRRRVEEMFDRKKQIDKIEALYHVLASQ
jgi:glycosyltransferase involved in cell wall biosynthesis